MKVFIVVDYQNDFVKGSLGFKEAASLDKSIVKRIKKAKEETTLVLATADTHTEDYLDTREGQALPKEHCILDTEGWEIYGKTGKIIEAFNIPIIKKSSFGAKSLPDQIIRGMYESIRIGAISKEEPIEEIELCGVVTNMCVISNAIILQNAFPEAEIVINAELCASFDKSLHEKSLDVMEGLQMSIINRKR